MMTKEPLTEEIAIDALRGFFREKPFLFFGTGMSCALDVRFGMVAQKQEKAGWGAKVIDRLSSDLKEAFPEMNGFSARNLKYMRKFAQSWPDRAIVQRVAAQIPWRNNQAILDKVKDPDLRICGMQNRMPLMAGVEIFWLFK